MYSERPSTLAGAAVWTRTPAPAAATPQRVIPDGCMDLIWVDGELLVAGPDTRPHFPTDVAGRHYTGLRFAPGTAPAVLGVPAAELRDQRVPLTALWPAAAARRLTEYVTSAPDRGRALETIAAHRLHLPSSPDHPVRALVTELGTAPPPDPAAGPIVARLRAGAPVATIADDLSLSERQLHRRSLAAFGYGPKMLARVLRLEAALTLARAGTPYADVAARAGYADQAHLARDVKSLTGVSLRTLLGP